MKTRRDISTISYNSTAFLMMKLDDLIDRHIISYYMFVEHKAEEDELKDHKHVFIRPNGQIDTMDLQMLLREYDEQNPSKPLGCIHFEYSDIDNWILYSSHYPPYLASKMESRQYKYDDIMWFTSSDYMSLDYYYKHAFKESKWAKEFQLLQVLTDGSIKPTELIDSGAISLNQASQLNAYMYMKTHYNKTDRNGRKGHNEKD